MQARDARLPRRSYRLSSPQGSAAVEGMGAGQSSPVHDTHRSDVSSDSSIVLTPSALAYQAGSNSSRDCSAASSPPEESQAELSRTEEMSECEEAAGANAESLPAWATTPVMPKQPRNFFFSMRSPLKELMHTR